MIGKVKIEYKVTLPGHEEPVLTPGEREKYPLPLEYIRSRTAEFRSVTTAPELPTLISGLQTSLQHLRKKVDHSQSQYAKLQSAVARLEKTIGEFDTVASETETAWNKLRDVENKLVEFPAYSALRPAEG
jgi:ABC-type transporter Mla subunit MlaD